MQKEPMKLQKRIGSTVYVSRIYFKNDTAESMTDKILRLVKNDLNFVPKSDTIELLQTERLHTHNKCVERGSA